ncbi:MAG: hypothetical protein EOP00_19510, partial [Pedobacter sp.]
GLYYTPSHLAKLLVDECLPLKKYSELDLSEFKVLDPACGSGIFLVIVYKRLVQIWRLQNNLKSPELKDLKKILRSIYGVDKEAEAIRLASFSLSLALCNELNPIKILTELKFDDLTERNLIHSDFFDCEVLKNKKFDLIIGNPPFITGALNNYSNFWKIENHKVKIPNGQIALKFLADSFFHLKDKGLVCLIIKSSGLLYNSTSYEYKSALFSNFNVIQILDFTALARNKSLWDNGADVASSAIFIRNQKPDFSKNILHVTFRRTKATIERIVFEIDDYDLHYVNKITAIKNEFIWKNNLLGGGRIKNLLEKVHAIDSFRAFLDNNNCIVGEGFKVGSKGHLSPQFIYNIKTLPTQAITEERIALECLTHINSTQKFEKIPNELIFRAPNIVIKENIGKTKIPIHLNETDFSFQHKVIGISSSKKILNRIINSFAINNDLYRFCIYVKSGQVLVNLNTAILKKDVMSLPFVENQNLQLTDIDLNIINDVNNVMQLFLRNGENSQALKPIRHSNFKSVILNYGAEFSKALNIIYENENGKFRMAQVIELENSFIATVFKYDLLEEAPDFQEDFTNLDLKELINYEITSHLSSNRIIKLYPQKNMVVFVKPNQVRYWLSLTAYRDADKCFSDFSNLITE